MIRSMTGFGRGESRSGEYRFLVEVKAVNHRFLSTSFRLPRDFDHLEKDLAELCAQRCARGHLAVQVGVELAVGASEQGPRLNRAVLDRLLDIAEGLEEIPGVKGGISVNTLFSIPGVIEWDAPSLALSDPAFLEGARAALGLAMDQVFESRTREGQALEDDLRERLSVIDARYDSLVQRAPMREANERERLQKKVETLLPKPDESMDQRLMQELVLYSDRYDIHEELTRLRAHLDHFEAELGGDAGAVGRKLTFLLQEMNREANTIAAKAGDAEMQRDAIEIKSEMEKMREQVENVE